jgi:hypothetical protein
MSRKIVQIRLVHLWRKYQLLNLLTVDVIQLCLSLAFAVLGTRLLQGAAALGATFPPEQDTYLFHPINNEGSLCLTTKGPARGATIPKYRALHHVQIPGITGY